MDLRLFPESSEDAAAKGLPRYSVSEFTERLKRSLESTFPHFQVYGEISNLKKQSSGHIYFALKDQGSQVSAVLFRADAQRNAIELQDGMAVLLEGAVSVYAPRGNYQIIVRKVRELGKGALQVQFERLKKKLNEEGLFRTERKRPLPRISKRVGLITSPTGAVIRDFISILRRLRWNGLVRLFPSRVQGKEGLPDLLNALEEANRPEHQLELIVFARGGGSLEDLWNFNEETLVRQIAASRLPIISAIGHETDFTLADFAADFRAETPSAAAEKVASGLVEYRQRFEQLTVRLQREFQRGVEEKKNHLNVLAQRAERVSPQNRIEELYQRLDDFADTLNRIGNQRLLLLTERLQQIRSRLIRVVPTQKILEWKRKIHEEEGRLERIADRQIQLLAERLKVVENRITQAGPQIALNRGFSLIKKEDGEIVTRLSEVHEGDTLAVQFQDGVAQVKVMKKIDL